MRGSTLTLYNIHFCAVSVKGLSHVIANGHNPSFEFAFVNLADVDDALCLADSNAEAAIGLITMKYAFDAEKYEALLPDIEQKLKSMDHAQGATLVGKIELYLGEYISRNALERLKMAFQSIGQRLGFVSAGDERRAAVERARKEERKKASQAISALKSRNSTLEAESAVKDARIRELEALLAQKA